MLNNKGSNLLVLNKNKEDIKDCEFEDMVPSLQKSGSSIRRRKM